MPRKITLQQKEQLKRLQEELLSIAPNVTTEDRAAAMLKFGISHATPTRYLGGDARDADTAAKLLKFWKQRIAKRESNLATSEPE